MVDVARQRDDRRRRLAALARADRLEDAHHPLERPAERRPVLEVEALAQLLAVVRADRAPGALAHRLVPGLEVVHPRREQQRQRRADQQVLAVAARVLLDPAPLLLVDHAARVRVEHPARARVDHHEPRRADVAAVAPARPLDLAVGLEDVVAEDVRAVLRLPHARVDVVVVELARREVAEVLVEPVRHEAADDAVVPPALGADVRDPRLRRVPVVVDVVVVEDHRRGHGREQPAHVGLAPRLPVQARVLLEVGDRLARRHLGVAARADELAHPRRDLVGVDLVAEQDQRLGPLGRLLRLHPVHERPQRVDLAAVGVVVLAQRVRRLVRRADAAGAEDDPRRPRRVVGADDAGRQLAVRQRPHASRRRARPRRA